jgi:hypothetical protein
LEVAGVLFADGVALVTCMASFGAGCAAAGGAGLLHGNLVADVKGCDKKLEEKGCPLQRTAYDQHVATVISGTLARLANEDVPRGGLGTGLSVQQSHRGPATVPEIDVPDPYEALQISSVTRDQLERLYRTGVRRLDQLSERYYNGELSEAELMQLVQRTHHEMDQEMEKLLGKEGMRQFVEMMAAYSRDLLELYGIRGEPR